MNMIGYLPTSVAVERMRIIFLTLFSARKVITAFKQTAANFYPNHAATSPLKHRPAASWT